MERMTNARIYIPILVSVIFLCNLIFVYESSPDLTVSETFEYIHSNAKQYYNNTRNSTWLTAYNQTLLQTYLSSTFKAYSTRPDRLQPSRESVIDVENSTILFHGQFKDPKLGPCVSLYWQSRMFSFFSSFYKFKLADTNNSHGHRPVQTRIWFDPKQYFAYLPKESDIHAMDVSPAAYGKYQDWILYWLLMTRKKKYIGLYVYASDHMDLMFSKLFLAIIRHETNVAFNAYFKLNKLTSEQDRIASAMWVHKTDDTVVHIRCQDVLLGGPPGYGMNSLQYFSDAITNVFQIRLHSNMAIHIVLFLGGIAGRQGSAENVKACHSYLHQFVVPAFEKVFMPAQIKLITDGSINNDFYTFIKAPHMICGLSSFCIMGAIANENRVVLSAEWTPHYWYQSDAYAPFGPIADNLNFVKDGNVLKSVTVKQKGWNVTQIARLTMVLNGSYVL